VPFPFQPAHARRVRLIGRAFVIGTSELTLTYRTALAADSSPRPFFVVPHRRAADLAYVRHCSILRSCDQWTRVKQREFRRSILKP
jgi:hypothetical protein